MNTSRSKKYAPWLWFLLGLFCFRVIAQLLALKFDLKLLPPFEKWHSSAMPYWLLVVFQMAIIFVCTKVAIKFTMGNISPNRRNGVILLGFGAIYLAIMLSRFILGMTLFPSDRWFTNYIPTFFHIVLASFVLVAGSFHMQKITRG